MHLHVIDAGHREHMFHAPIWIKFQADKTNLLPHTDECYSLAWLKYNLCIHTIIDGCFGLLPFWFITENAYMNILWHFLWRLYMSVKVSKWLSQFMHLPAVPKSNRCSNSSLILHHISLFIYRQPGMDVYILLWF